MKTGASTQAQNLQMLQIEFYQEQYGVKQIENCSLSEDVLRVVGDMSLENMISSEQGFYTGLLLEQIRNSQEEGASA